MGDDRTAGWAPTNGGVHTQDEDGPGDREPGAEPGGTDVHERARQGVEHLQAAARELIAAARAALDVAEEVVNDPDAVGSLAGVVAGLGEMYRRVAGGGWPPSATREPAPEDERQAKVERIRVT